MIIRLKLHKVCVLDYVNKEDDLEVCHFIFIVFFPNNIHYTDCAIRISNPQKYRS